MIPVGNYKARGVEAALSTTREGKPQVAVLIEITEGEHAGERRTWFGHFTEKTEEKTFEQLRTLGWSTDDLTDLAGIDANEVSIKVEHETDQDGQQRDRIRWINRPGAGLAIKERMDDAAARAFAARMRAKAVASRVDAPKPAARTATPQRNGAPRFDDAPPPSDGDALPF
jgi:hypothetical protein